MARLTFKIQSGGDIDIIYNYGKIISQLLYTAIDIISRYYIQLWKNGTLPIITLGWWGGLQGTCLRFQNNSDIAWQLSRKAQKTKINKYEASNGCNIWRIVLEDGMYYICFMLPQ